MRSLRSLARALISTSIIALAAAHPAPAVSAGPGDAARGKTLFQQNCALCHADRLSPSGAPIMGQGPSLVGVLGRRAGSLPRFGYTPALRNANITWNVADLDRFIAHPSQAVPGTSMPAAIANERDRADVIAYLAKLTPAAQPGATSGAEAGESPSAAKEAKAAQATNGTGDNSWRDDAPGVVHRIKLSDLPAPYQTSSAGNSPEIADPPANASLSAPPGFKVARFANGLTNPRLIRVAPNGDVFIAETAAGRIRVLRAADGADAASENRVFADKLDGPFGIAFYPPGNDPRWVYVANNNSIVRFAYRNGDLRAREGAETVVRRLADSSAGHTTRDIAFSRDGKRLFISVGSGSNVAQGIGRLSRTEIAAWEKQRGIGAAWGGESNRADILVTDPEGNGPLRTFATGIRNGVSVAVNPQTGDLWTVTNERDGLGDDLVPDYVTRVKEHAFYGWPWYYLGNHQDPRHKEERADLADRVTLPDLLLQAHSAPLGLCFYTATTGPSLFPGEYRGNMFVALHGSWNRNRRTGYKVVRVPLKNGVPTGEYIDFMTGFVIDDQTVWGRPVSVAVAHDGALLVTDDGSDSVWRVSYAGR
jgi:glucose/arabinose dehydrogenase